MKYFPLVWTQLWRKPLRTLFTLVSIVVAFFLFGVLQGIDAGFSQVIEASRLDRLITDSRFFGLLPMAYADQIARIPGVTLVVPQDGLGGFYQNPKNRVFVRFFGGEYFAAYPEVPITKEQLATFNSTRTAAVVSAAMAQQNGWRVGDKIPIQSPIVKQDASPVWTFDLVAIMADLDLFPNGFFIANYDYLDQARAQNKGTIRELTIRTNDPKKAIQISSAIDDIFVNSSTPTRTQSERTYAQQSFERAININLVTDTITGAVFFMLLFITSSTMMQALRERIPEIAVLKTIGFSDANVLTLVLMESILLCVFAASLGLGLSEFVVPAVKPLLGGLNIPLRMLPTSVVIGGLVVAVLVALVSGLPPARRAKRLVVVDALAGR